MAKAKAKAKPAAKPGVAQPSLATLRGLLGKPVDDPAVTKVVEAAGKVKVSSDFIVAKEAGFDFALERPATAKRNSKKLLKTLFLFPDEDDRVASAELPKGFAFTSRANLLAKLPRPKTTWQIGPGSVSVETEDVAWDMWEVDGVEILASYRQAGAAISHFCISLPDDQTGGSSLSDHPLHFEAKPADAPPDAELVGMALLVAWAADRFGLPARHASTELGKQFAARAISPRTFLIQACDQTLTTLDVVPALGEFLSIYTRNQHSSDEGARAPVAARIKELLALSRDDERRYSDDFLGTFSGVCENPFHVPDSWAAVDRIAPVIDARWTDFQATSFRTIPELAPYEVAAAKRDQVSVTPDRATVAKITVDDSFAEELIGLIDKPLTDKHVKDVITKAGMPVGKKIDQQANPALGIAYMGTKLEIGGKKVMGVDAVWFYADKYESYIRGIGSKVVFAGFPGVLPAGVRIGDSRALVRTKLGEPKQVGEDYDYYWPSDDRRIACKFEHDKLAMIRYGKPTNY